eukprot:jgi/Galph1/5667/GphlegSOOS_G4347.1
MGRDKLSAHPVEKYWKDRKNKEKEKHKKERSRKRQSHKPTVSLEALEEEIASLIQKKNDGVLLASERERLVQIIQLHDNVLGKQAKFGNHSANETKDLMDPLDPEHGEDNREEARKRIIESRSFQRILEKTKTHSSTGEEFSQQEEPQSSSTVGRYPSRFTYHLCSHVPVNSEPNSQEPLLQSYASANSVASGSKKVTSLKPITVQIRPTIHPPPKPSSSQSQSTTIQVPDAVLDSFYAELGEIEKSAIE